MEMYKAGQEVIVVDDSRSIVDGAMVPFTKHEIVTVVRCIQHGRHTGAVIKEYPLSDGEAWRAERFAPIVSNKELQKELNEVTENVMEEINL